MEKQTIIINGENFSDVESFYIEIDKVLTKDLDWNTGHNLNAFNDLLRGGFGIYEYEEPITLIWRNISKSKNDLKELAENNGQSFFDVIIEIISGHEQIEFKTED